MFIEPIAAFTDNYIWCLHDGSTAWVVDPGEASPVLVFLAAKKLRLQGILITHHHHDHTGGIGQLRQAFSDLTVYGPHNRDNQPCIKGLDKQLEEGDTVDVFGYSFDVLEIPGHTLDHIAYYAADSHPPTLFCGDTLFAAGCGRLFEGTPPQMLASLQKLAQLPTATAVYCGHEYTVANLRFAQAVEPDNAVVRERAAEAATLRAEQRPTLPSNIGLELATNPFLRCQTPSVLAAARRHGAQTENLAAIFAAIRGWKDQF
ncbi:MAG TPA: hydroxyacylglutathione hydrolase [Spongiibacteraceae bacterium]|nr:hydroxyacylglutathione hydrolase [Spongiibacteraceae bacterium]